jgi:hypothetical protein
MKERGGEECNLAAYLLTNVGANNGIGCGEKRNEASKWRGRVEIRRRVWVGRRDWKVDQTVECWFWSWGIVPPKFLG